MDNHGVLVMFTHKIISRSIISSFVLAIAIGMAAAPAGAGELSNYPLTLIKAADPNVLINLSVEHPMGGSAYNDGNAPTYVSTTTYVGYFDPDKCYVYQNARFEPSSGATNHACPGKFSGNFMNWATMTPMDAFLVTMTGGNRMVDTEGLTVIKRARRDGGVWDFFADKTVSSAINTSITPTWNGKTLIIKNTKDAWTVKFQERSGSWPYTYTDLGTYNVYIKVCNPSVTGLSTDNSLEDNCVRYEKSDGTVYYKPQGLIQNNADSKRFALSSYLDTSRTDGGVMRAMMKYVGPKMPSSNGMIDNPYAEFGEDGLLKTDPDDQSDTDGVEDSGVINFLNRFTETFAHGYKQDDPVSELFYESLRYYRGDEGAGPTDDFVVTTDDEKGEFPVYTDWTDPIQYSCQKNFIIAINDPYTFYDKRVPGTHFTDEKFDQHTLGTDQLGNIDYGEPSNPDTWFDATEYTNKVGELQWGASGTTMQIGCIDNNCPDGGLSVSSQNVTKLGQVFGLYPYANNENSYYVAGLAYQANTEDIRVDITGTQTVTTFMVDVQEYKAAPLVGETNQLWLTGKYGGFIDSNDNKKPDLQSEWDADGDGTPDNYVVATKPENMVKALNASFESVDAQAGSASSSAVVANSVRLQTGTEIYQASYDSSDWSGDLQALPLAMDGNINPKKWSARDNLDTKSYSERNIFTYDPVTGAGKLFIWSGTGAITSAQQNALDINPDSNADDDKGEDRLGYIRGNPAKEQKNSGGTFRDRDHKLGDLVNSSPIYVGPPAFNYPDTMVADGETIYNTFAQSKLTRMPVLYVGGNDGMLHAFNASSGEELMAYVPGFLLPELNELTSPKYSHRYYVDGNPTYGDAYFDSDGAGTNPKAWHTVLAGGARAGGQGYFLLDITDPSTAFAQTAANAANLALWEFTDANDSDLGYSFSQPAIIKTNKDGKWAVIFGNGYHSADADGHAGKGHAVLYILFIEGGIDGSWTINSDYIKIDTGVGGNNGLSTPAPIDTNGDQVVDYIYAGDLKGNLWKFDVSSSDTTKWVVAGGDTPLFTAKDKDGNVQPITVRPDVGVNPQAGYMVYFGTGKFFEKGDSDPSRRYGNQTFYGVWDKTYSAHNKDMELDRSKLKEQTINTEIYHADGVTAKFRSSSDYEVVWKTQYGWYMELPETGEQVVADPLLNHENIVFVTQTPSSDPCKCDFTSWTMEVAALDGGWPEGPVFDTNGDGEINSSDDWNSGANRGTGYQETDSDGNSENSANSRPTIVSAGTKEYKYESRSSGGVAHFLEAGGLVSGRQSWEQIR